MTHTPHDALFKAVFSSPEHADEVLGELIRPDASASLVLRAISSCRTDPSSLRRGGRARWLRRRPG
jgi:hypothetical protein